MQFSKLKQNQFAFFAFAFFIVILFFIYQYVDFLKSQKDAMEKQTYQSAAIDMQKTLEQMILVKRKATIAIALGIANDKELTEWITQKQASKIDYTKLIKSFKDNTLYKNIWIQVMDKEANVLYRSWSQERGENLLAIRQDVQDVIQKQTILSSINPGRHSLSIRAITPLYKEGAFCGMLEVISHFNSISKSLKSSNINSVVVLKKEFKEQLTHPMTELFIGEYYVANQDALPLFMEYLQAHGIENYLNNSYKVENGKLVVSYALKDLHGRVVGYYIMSKNGANISKIDLDYYMFKWGALSIMLIMGIAIIAIIFLYRTKARDKRYYQNIINTSSNIIILGDATTTHQANKTFFSYFKEFATIEDVQEQKKRICDYFVEEKGYLSEYMDGVNWLIYLVNNKDKHHKVKLILDGTIKYFTISASLISVELGHYAVIMTNITEQENYKKELEYLSTTDVLTGIGNRRHFQNKMHEECVRAKRYKYPLSMVIFDIDYFKLVNDKYGHNVGDEVLYEYATKLADMLRENDIFCRIGGEEFVLLLPHVGLEDAKVTAEKIRLFVESWKKVVPITMSFGVVEYIQGESEDGLFKRADEALYTAKEQGRNRVVVG